MKITMTIEVTLEQAAQICAILGNSPADLTPPAPVQTAPAAPAIPAAPAPTAVPVSPAVLTQAAVPVPAAAAPVAPMPTIPAPAAPMPTVPAPAAPMPTVPAPAAPPPPTAIPTAVHEYTMDELSLASRPIVETGRQQELLDLMHSFTFTDAAGVTRNVQNIREMPKELYPAFANGIRQLGGRI